MQFRPAFRVYEVQDFQVSLSKPASRVYEVQVSLPCSYSSEIYSVLKCQKRGTCYVGWYVYSSQISTLHHSSQETENRRVGKMLVFWMLIVRVHIEKTMVIMRFSIQKTKEWRLSLLRQLNNTSFYSRINHTSWRSAAILDSRSSNYRSFL